MTSTALGASTVLQTAAIDPLESIGVIVDSNRRPVSQMVLAKLTQMIVSGAWKAGDTLPSESELARMLNVSKTIIRESVRQLAVLGVIDIQQGKASTVRTLTAQPLELFFRFAMVGRRTGLREAIELRLALETHIVTLAAERMETHEVRSLEEIVKEMWLHKDDLERWVQLDLAFHLAIADGAKNELCRLVMHALRGIVEESMRIVNVRFDLRDPVATVRRHEKILQSIQQHDPDAARHAMSVHFGATTPLVNIILSDSEG